MSYCQECGSQLIDKELEHEGIVPYCPMRGEYRFPMYNIAVSMVVNNEENQKPLLIKQYGKNFYPEILAGQFLNAYLDEAQKTELGE